MLLLKPNGLKSNIMEVVLITRKNGVSIRFGGDITSISYDATYGRFELHTHFLHLLQIEGKDSDNNPIDWTEYNVDLRPGYATIYDVVRVICA